MGCVVVGKNSGRAIIDSESESWSRYAYLDGMGVVADELAEVAKRCPLSACRTRNRHHSNQNRCRWKGDAVRPMSRTFSGHNGNEVTVVSSVYPTPQDTQDVQIVQFMSLTYPPYPIVPHSQNPHRYASTRNISTTTGLNDSGPPCARTTSTAVRHMFSSLAAAINLQPFSVKPVGNSVNRFL